MKISIVTPSFNSEKYIRETLESIHGQSYKNIEHFVMDGLSSDNTVAIVKEYPNAILSSEKDKGQSNAINKGFEKTTGEILAWQNADDLYLPNTFATVVDFFKAHPSVDVVYGNYQLIDERSQWICDVAPIDWNSWLFAHGRFCPLQPTVFWRRRVYEMVGPLDEQLHYCMDVDLFARMVKQGFIFARIPEILGKFRVHTESKTQNSDNDEKVYNEHKIVLARNFEYNYFDEVAFKAFHLRAKFAKKIKTTFLKKF